MQFLTTLSTQTQFKIKTNIQPNHSSPLILTLSSTLISLLWSSNTITCHSSSQLGYQEPQLLQIECQIVSNNNSQCNLSINHQRHQVQIVRFQDHIRIFRYPKHNTFLNYSNFSNLPLRINLHNNKWQCFHSSKYITSLVPHCVTVTWTALITWQILFMQINTCSIQTLRVQLIHKVKASSGFQINKERQLAHHSLQETCIDIIRWCRFRWQTRILWLSKEHKQ